MAFHAQCALAGAREWTAIGPDGAEIVVLAADPGTPGTLYAGTRASGVLTSVDSGAHWTAGGKGLPSVPVRAIAIDPRTPSTLYAGTSGAGVYKSLDSGAHWVPVNNDLGDATQGEVNAIAVDPGTPTTVYAGTSSGLFKSKNAGANWTAIGAGAIFPDVTNVAVDPSTPSTIYAGSFGFPALARSADGGTTWSLNLLGQGYGNSKWSRQSPGALLIDPRVPSRLYVALGSEVMLRSVDHGETWTRIELPGDGPATIATDPASFETLYAASYAGDVYRSTDAGTRWSPVAAKPTIDIIRAFAVTPSTRLHVGTRHGLHHSLDAGASWTRPALGVRVTDVPTFVVDPNAPSTIYAGLGWPLEDIVMKTVDSGTSWTGVTLPARLRTYWVDPIATSTLYATGYDGVADRDYMYKSIDAGKTWTTIYGSQRIDSFAIAPSQPTTLYVAGADGLQRSVDGASSWSRVTSPGTYVSALAVHPARPDVVYAGKAGALLESTDGGLQWRTLPATIPDGTAVYELAIDPALPTTVYAAFATFWDPIPGGILKSTDGGESWVEVLELDAQYYAPSLAIDATDTRRLYVALTDRGVYQTTDGGASWTTLNTGLPSLDVHRVTIDRSGKLLRAATSLGLFEYDLAPVPPAQIASVIEYYHPSADHYFITASGDEIEALDSRRFAGWMRTGFAFGAYATPAAGAKPVCRFFSTAFGAKGAHFYSPFEGECDAASDDWHWTLETRTAFHATVPSANGACAEGLSAVYRLYNDGRGGAPNHRYTTDLALRAQMIAQGWVPEGLGPQAVVMCAPS